MSICTSHYGSKLLFGVGKVVTVIGMIWQGMGEGEGAKDVSDQITDEDQLLGAQQKDQPADAAKVCQLSALQRTCDSCLAG